MTVARRLAGERFSLKEQAAGCFDLDVGRIAVERFEEAGDLLDQALPGRGDVRRRLDASKLRHELPSRKAHLLPALFERVILESRRRTDDLVGLPEGEEVTFGPWTADRFWPWPSTVVASARASWSTPTDLSTWPTSSTSPATKDIPGTSPR
jgi:hypothetical protein